MIYYISDCIRNWYDWILIISLERNSRHMISSEIIFKINLFSKLLKRICTKNSTIEYLRIMRSSRIIIHAFDNNEQLECFLRYYNWTRKGDMLEVTRFRWLLMEFRFHVHICHILYRNRHEASEQFSPRQSQASRRLL